MLLRLRMLLACSLLCGCTVAKASLSISTAQLDPALLGSVVRIDVLVLGGTLPGGYPLECEPLAAGEVDLDDEALDVQYRASLEYDADAGGAVGDPPEPVGHLAEGRFLFLVQAWDDSCRVLASSCLLVALGSGRDRDLFVDLEPVAAPRSACAPGLACVDDRCGPCQGAGQCDDGDPCTVDLCDEGLCSATPGVPDVDRDGYGSEACGGDDCDDDDPLRHPGAPRRCGSAVDHDCDGLVDDAQGCDPCEGAADLRPLGSIATSVAALSVVGPAPEGEAVWELFVSTTDGLIEVYSVDEEGAASGPSTTSHVGAQAFAPQVLGDYTVVADAGDAGLSVYLTDDLRAGSALPVAQAASEIGAFRAFLAGTRAAVVCHGTGEGALSRVDLSRLPDLPGLERVETEGGWHECEGLAREPGWLYGAYGAFLSWAELDADGAVAATGVVNLSTALAPSPAGTGSSVAALPGILALGRSRTGLLLLDRDGLGPDGDCCGHAGLALPEGCAGSACYEVLDVAPVGPSRVLALADAALGAQRTFSVLVDVGSVDAPAELASLPLSDPEMAPQALAVSANRAFAAGTGPSSSGGVIDVLEILCE